MEFYIANVAKTVYLSHIIFYGKNENCFPVKLIFKLRLNYVSIVSIDKTSVRKDK